MNKWAELTSDEVNQERKKLNYFLILIVYRYINSYSSIAIFVIVSGIHIQ